MHLLHERQSEWEEPKHRFIQEVAKMIKGAPVDLRNRFSQWLLLGNHSTLGWGSVGKKSEGEDKVLSRPIFAFEKGLIEARPD